MTTRTNLSALALKYSTLTVFFMIALVAAGVYAFFNLGRGEDPPFTIKQMVVSAAWPGATSREMEQQVTEKIETKLQELPYINFVNSYTKPGETVIYVSLRDDTPPGKVPDLWYQVRKKVGDIRGSLPQGVVGPFFNDEYGDTYSLIWAFEADGFSPAEVKEIVKAVRQRLLRVPDVTKADLIGLQDEKIYIEFSHARLAMLGIPVDQILEVVRRQNAIVAAGTVETKGERVSVRVEGAPISAEELASLPFSANGRTLMLSRRGRDQARLPGPAADLHALQGQAGDRARRGDGPGRQRADAGQGARQGDGRRREGPAGRHHRAPRRQPARGRRQVVRGVHLLAARGAGHRAGRVVHQPGRAHRRHRGAVGAAGAGHHLRRHAAARHRLPADLARRADHCARPAGRRRHHRRRDDDGEARARRQPARGRDLRLHLDRLPHADRHAGHRRRLRAGGLRALERRRVHQLDLLGGRPVAGHLVVRGRAVHAVDGLPPAADAQGPSCRSLWRPALHRLPQAGRVVRDLAQDHHRHHGTGLRRLLGRLHPGAEAVLPDGQPARADRRPEAGAGRLVGRHRPRSAPPGEVAGREPRRRLLHVLCRRRQPALLPADRAGAVQRELRPGHRHDQGPRRPRARGRRSRTSCSPTASRPCAPACSACRTARRSATR